MHVRIAEQRLDEGLVGALAGGRRQQADDDLPLLFVVRGPPALGTLRGRHESGEQRGAGQG